MKIHDNFDLLSPRFKYWVTHILRENKEETLRDFYLKELIKSHPLNFYSILSHLILDQHNKNPDMPLPDSSYSFFANNKTFSSFVASHKTVLKRIMIWSHLGKQKLVSAEVKKVYSDLKKKKLSTEKLQYSVFHLVQTLNQTKNYLASFSLIHKIVAYDSSIFNEKYLDFLFPLPFQNEVKSKQIT